MLVHSHTSGVSLLARLAKQLAARRSVVPLLHIDADQVEESIERFDNSPDVVCIVQLVTSIQQNGRGQQMQGGQAV